MNVPSNGAGSADKQSIIGELNGRLGMAAQDLNGIALDLHAQADRVFGPAPTEAAKAPPPPSSAPTTMVQDLAATLEWLTNRIADVRAGVTRLRPIA